jgi:hypothetical protein
MAFLEKVLCGSWGDGAEKRQGVILSNKFMTYLSSLFSCAWSLLMK